MNTPNYWEEMHRPDSYLFAQYMYAYVGQLNGLEAWINVDHQVDNSGVESTW